MQRYMLWCWYAGSSFEVKIETDSNDVTEIKKEVDSNDITECLHHGYPFAGMFAVSNAMFSAVIPPSPSIDNIWAMMFVWR